MPAGSLTISQTITEIRGALSDYIEATYHMGNPHLIAQRRELLGKEGVIFQVPYIESTPRYTTARHFEELKLPRPALELLEALSRSEHGEEAILHNPPYRHQAEALEGVIRDEKSLVVSTGTGSGKTETFLLPILAKLAIEARERPISFKTPAVRALLMYPMNALVNDQLGRLRLLFGNSRVSSYFLAQGGRPARFARYTSRTLYPGVRTAKKDQRRLKSIETFYIHLLTEASDSKSPRQSQAKDLIENLKSRGKWPGKPELEKWYGGSGKRWQGPNGEFVRAVLRMEDTELFTRHEVLGAPPDLLVTNYSMLEYMLMRPLERPVFDATARWLKENPGENFLLIVDEAHLYRGASGAEVGLLLRRLRSRLGVTADRLQVICTSASFNDKEYSRDFAAQLVGKSVDDFVKIEGELAFRQGESRGSEKDAHVLASVPLAEFYEADKDEGRLKAVANLLAHLNQKSAFSDVGRALHEALRNFPPMSLLVNMTMQEATPLEELGLHVFDTQDPELAERAVTTLLALGSAARISDQEPGLLPCRVHAFFRGLPGLWACLDPDCSHRGLEYAGSPIGALYAQPRSACSCGARVFELYTCRNCGSAYARGYVENLDEPDFLWHEPGGGFRSSAEQIRQLEPIDLLLEDPNGMVEPAELDLVTGRLNPAALGGRMRRVFLPLNRTGDPRKGGDDEDGVSKKASGEFRPCGVCVTYGGYGRSSVQDHQTKGDQPFQALVTKQIEVQPPGQQRYSEFAPLRGRKVLVFSDSRQAAARLAPNLQTYSMQDVLRPLILGGWRSLNDVELLAPSLNLDDLYLAVLVGSSQLSVRVRPELKGTESLHVAREVAASLERGALSDPAELIQLLSARSSTPPQSLLRGIFSTITDRYYGFQSLGLASVREKANLLGRIQSLPEVPGLASSNEEKIALGRLWLSQWASPNPGIWMHGMNKNWDQTTRGVRSHKGKFQALDRWIEDKAARKAFEKNWIPELLDTFCEQVASNQYKMLASNLGLSTASGWGYCEACRTTQRPFPNSHKCINCGRMQVVDIEPDTDPVFSTRKGYYRSSSLRAMEVPPRPPMAIIAAEHTAQLNAAQSDEVFSKAEEHELLFQDVNFEMPTPGEQPRVAIDVLSCTTTMEVGIDIGALSGVALRNMPPSRANYQQRAGRAGRRGNAVATVVAFGSSDSHDEHNFAEPDAMIRGFVVDPVLTLNNIEIARRHLTAFLFQKYHQDRLPMINPEDQPQLFEVLGTVESFLGSSSPLNRSDFEVWLRANQVQLEKESSDWLPTELFTDDREQLLRGLVDETLRAIDKATEDTDPALPESTLMDTENLEEGALEAPSEPGEEIAKPRRSFDNLLDRLLYKGVLPRYAFPTDVVSFYVFDKDRSTPFRPEYRYAPSQGLPVALTQYAPGKEVWIDGKEWRSGALYSPMQKERSNAWKDRKIYFECSVCHYARTDPAGSAHPGQSLPCPACGSAATFGAAKNWIRPPGFAHPQSVEEGTSNDDQPARSHATRAKLVAGTSDISNWRPATDRIKQYYERATLLVTNTGPLGEGYTYCTWCGLIEPTASPTTSISGVHPKPYPDSKDPNCPGSGTTRGLVLGTDFISDVLLISMKVEAPVTLRPGLLATDVALRTICEALTLAATNRLEIEPGEVQAEYRPALTLDGHNGLEVEIYVYDTLAGGAGFARRIGDLGSLVFEDAISLLEDCPEGCDYSCYRCLRSFRNRFEHELLDRHLGASLLRYLVRGEEPVLGKTRLERAVDLIFQDLDRQGRSDFTLTKNARIELPGIGAIEAPIFLEVGENQFILGVHGPLTPDFASDEKLRDAKEYGSSIPVILLDEIVISRSLPRATQLVVAQVT